jgi:CRISPR-associated protein Csm3
MKQLVKKIKINTSITLITGLHIGGNSENVEIGGIDTPVIKLASKGDVPYIPGSSLKGKMRCLLEQAAGASKVGLNKDVNNLFGITKNNSIDVNDNRPSKLIVRDAILTEDSKAYLLGCDNLDMPYTENKYENTIDRVTAKANPRNMERVPAGAEFNAEFIINVWDDDDEQELLALFKKGIRLLENDYLGGSGSRGYGQIKFGEMKPIELSDANNWTA